MSSKCNVCCLISNLNFSDRRLGDINQYGLSDYSRLYQTKDGWIYISAEGNTDAFHHFINIYDDNIESERGENEFGEDYLHTDYGLLVFNVFKSQTTGFWINKLSEAGINAAESVENYDVLYFDDPHPKANDMIATHVTNDLVEHKYVTGFIKFDELPSNHSFPTPKLGEHSREILKEFGFDDMFIDSIIGDNVLITPDL